MELMCDWDILYSLSLTVGSIFFKFKNYHPRLPHPSLNMKLSRLSPLPKVSTLIL